MLHLRLSCDVKCPRHPLRNYQERPAGCGICQHLAEAAASVREAETELRRAFELGAVGTNPKGKLPAAVEIGRLGGKARARANPTRRLSEIGRKGAAARWKKVRKKT